MLLYLKESSEQKWAKAALLSGLDCEVVVLAATVEIGDGVDFSGIKVTATKPA
jgi:hypothetical protein